MVDEKRSNEWHEQVEYSEIYFHYTKECREAQKKGDLITWSSTLQAKVSLILGVLDDKEKPEVKAFVNALVNHTAKYIKAVQYCKRLASSGGRIPVPRFVIKQEELLFQLLFEGECEIDTLANKYMPFLNIKDEFDIEGL